MSFVVAALMFLPAMGRLVSTPSPEALAARPAFQVIDPVAGQHVLTSSFGLRLDPFTGRVAFHNGIDLASAMDTPIFAAEAGHIVIAERRGPYGNMIEIDHGNGFRTRYGQLNAILVKAGDRVRRGQNIAQMGSTGRSTGPHLHFEIWENGVVKDPAPFVRFAVRMAPIPDRKAP